MSAEIDELEAKIRSLSGEARAELIRALIADLDGPADADAERAWLEEARRRQREIVDGSVKTVPADRVFANLRSRLAR